MRDDATNPMVPLLVDSHCHLDLEQFDADRDRIVARAAHRGVRLIVNPGIDLEHSRRAIALADRYESVYAAVGIHPNSASDFGDETLAVLRQMAKHPKVVAIGEIGLDYYWDRVDPAQQAEVFRAQLDLATELGLPVIIHNRDASDDVATILETWSSSEASHHSTSTSATETRRFRGVLHAFGGDFELARRAYGWDFVLGLGGPVTFKNARDLHALVPHLRPDRLMIETDAPYLTPHPHRGKRNEPAHVALVAERLAELRDEPLSRIAQQTTDVALSFFGLTDRFADAQTIEDSYELQN